MHTSAVTGQYKYFSFSQDISSSLLSTKGSCIFCNDKRQNLITFIDKQRFLHPLDYLWNKHFILSFFAYFIYQNGPMTSRLYVYANWTTICRMWVFLPFFPFTSRKKYKQPLPAFLFSFAFFSLLVFCNHTSIQTRVESIMITHNSIIAFCDVPLICGKKSK